MLNRAELFVMRGIQGHSMKYTAHFTNDLLTHVTNERGKTLARGKDLYTGRDYAFAADVYGKSHTVNPAARRKVAALRKQTRRTDKTFTGLKQKRPGGRPTERRIKDEGRRSRQKRYEAIIRRIKGVRDCSRKEAQKIYKHYLPTICAGYPPESNTPHIVMISRAISDPEQPITWIYKDENSPKVLFDPDSDETQDYTYLRAVSPFKVTYGAVIKTLPDKAMLESLWADSESYAGRSLIDTDYMLFIGVAADDVPVLK